MASLYCLVTLHKQYDLSSIKLMHCHLHRPLKTRLMQLPLSQLRPHLNKASAAYPKLTCTGYYQNPQASSYHSCPKISSLAKNPRTHPLQSSVYNSSLQYSQPTYLRELFTIQPTRSSSCLTLSRLPVTSHLMFSN